MQLVDQAELGELLVRVVIDRESPQPQAPVADSSCAISIERDPAEYRGTGGILRDLTSHYDDDDFILVANAAQVMLEPLHKLVASLAGKHADVSLISHKDGEAASLMLIRCGCLRDLPGVGFVDFKEQALVKIAANHQVAVVQRAAPTAMAIRTAAEYIAAVLQHHRQTAGKAISASAFAEDWEATFGLIEHGAEIGAGARVHDSVVLSGAKLERDALVVRSVICPGGVVRSGQMIVDEVVKGDVRRKRGVDL